jgi:hypothetical protein
LVASAVAASELLARFAHTTPSISTTAMPAMTIFCIIALSEPVALASGFDFVAFGSGTTKTPWQLGQRAFLPTDAADFNCRGLEQ